MGACFNQLMENESKESLAQMVCDGFDKIATLEQRVKELEAELADERLAFEHANEVVGSLEAALHVKELEKQNKQQVIENLTGNLTRLETELAQAKADYEELREGRRLDAENVDAAFDREEKLQQELAQARAENERLKEIGNKGCDCSPEEACRFAAERDASINRVQELERKLEAVRGPVRDEEILAALKIADSEALWDAMTVAIWKDGIDVEEPTRKAERMVLPDKTDEHDKGSS